MPKKQIRLDVKIYNKGIIPNYSFVKKKLARSVNYFFKYRAKGRHSILAYHHVVSPFSENHLLFPSEYITQELFEAHVQWLKERYYIIPLRKIFENHQSKSKSSKTRDQIALTFDDGWGDFYSFAYPILKRNNIPATVFLVTDFIDTKRQIWFNSIKRVTHELKNNPALLKSLFCDDVSNILNNKSDLCLIQERLSRLDGGHVIDLLKHYPHHDCQKLADIWNKVCRSYNSDFVTSDKWLSWAVISEMEKSGLIDFGMHGSKHLFIPHISEKDFSLEVIHCRDTLKSRTNSFLNCYCYPGGLYLKKHTELLADMGIDFAVTYSGGVVKPGTSPYQISRVGVNSLAHDEQYPLYNAVECIPFYFKKYPPSPV